MNNNVVYIYRNIINGKVYVGQTSNPRKRCSESGYKNCPYFYNAIQKYGWENFERIIIKKDLDAELANYWEKLLIEFFDSSNNKFGYNLSEGGAHKAVLKGNNNGFFGKTHSEESIKRMKEKKIGGNNPLAKPVICLTTGDVFPSAKEASDWCGASRQHINRVCRKERKHTGIHPQTKEPLEWEYYKNEI